MGLNFNIKPVSKKLEESLQHKIDFKTKPLGALGQLENIAFKIGNIQQTLTPKLSNPTIVVFAADHGIAKEGLVNPYPQEVTRQMVLNFIDGGAAINVFARQNKINLKIVDAGVNHDFGKTEGLIDHKIAFGTQNYLKTAAMTLEQCEEAISKGAHVIEELCSNNCNIVGFGEMGIGNTSSSALLMSLLCSIPIDQCVGNGTGVNAAQLKLKLKTLKKVLVRHKNIDTSNPIAVLRIFGGFEIAQMCGGILKAAALGITILIDGFISTTALLVAYKIDRNVLNYVIFSHHSNEKGHGLMLDFFNANPVINLNMRLGEGSGIAVAYPIIHSACKFLNEMASFETARVTNKR
jgi:nicotinate-nucleotide--dimethylbenzimidazole phosphoribosyltransferase